MNDDVDDIMSVYGSKCRGIYVPNPEQEFQEKCKKEVSGLLEKYGFNKKPQQQTLNETVKQPKPEIPQQKTVLSEKQQRNQTLFEASVLVAKAIPFFESIEDKKYVNQIKEALEELIG